MLASCRLRARTDPKVAPGSAVRLASSSGAPRSHHKKPAGMPSLAGQTQFKLCSSDGTGWARLLEHASVLDLLIPSTPR